MTPLAFVRLESIAGAHSQLKAIVVGTSYLVKELHARHSRARSETLTALSVAILAGRAHGLCVLDGVHLEVDDDEGLPAACEQGRAIGVRREDSDSSETDRRGERNLWTHARRA